MNFAVKITSPFPYLSLKSTAGAFRYFSVHDKMKFHDLLSFCYHSQRWNFEAEQRQLRLDQHSRLRFLPQSGFGNLWRIWLLSKPVGKTAKTSFFYFKKSKYGSNSPHMSLIKIADRCASSSTNRITPSPECRASQSLYETIAVFLFARLPPRALLAASPLARDSCSATFPRGFWSKRETARSLEHAEFKSNISTSFPGLFPSMLGGALGTRLREISEITRSQVQMENGNE